MRPVLTVTLVAAAVLAAATSRARSEPQSQPKADAGVEALLNASPDVVRARYGAPDIARAEGRGAFWTYRLPACALYIFFKQGGDGQLAVSGASAGPRRRGQPALTVDACLAGVTLPTP